MIRILLLAALAASAAASQVVSAKGVQITAPEGWKRSDDGTTAVYAAPRKDASLRIDAFQKPKVTDADACLDELVTKLAAADKASKDSYVPGVVDGQPSAVQVTFSADRKHRQRRIVGCNGRSYFLIDWVELTHAGPSYAKAYTHFLAGIHYAAPTGDK